MIIFQSYGSGQVPPLEWFKTIGSSGDEEVTDFAIDDEGNLILIGNFFNTSDFDPGPEVFELTSNSGRDVFILKLNSFGEFVWVVSLKGQGNSEGWEVCLDGNNNILLTGINEGSSTDLDPGADQYNVEEGIFIVKLDENGEFIWGGGGIDTAHNQFVQSTSSIATDDDNNVYLTGYLLGEPSFKIMNSEFNLANEEDLYTSGFLFKISDNGELEWTKLFLSYLGTGVDAIEINEQNEIFISGVFYAFLESEDEYIESNQVTSGRSIYVAKLNIEGEIEDSNKFNGPIHFSVRGMDIDNENAIYITGYFRAGIDFDPGPLEQIHQSNGETDVFIVKLDMNTTPNFNWGTSFGSSNYDSGLSISVDDNNKSFVSGYYRDAFDVNGQPDSVEVNAFGFQDFFIGVFDEEGHLSGVKGFGDPENSESYKKCSANAIKTNSQGEVFVAGGYFGEIGLTNFNSQNMHSNGHSDGFIWKLNSSITTLYSPESNLNNGINVYPNPSSDDLNFSTDWSMHQIKIYNVNGQDVPVFLMDSNQLDFSAYDSGIYIVEFHFDEGIVRKKIIKD